MRFIAAKRLNRWTRQGATALFTLGASMTLGFLSFSGMYAITPVLWLGISAFALSNLYEGEIYFQNISSGLHQLLKPDNYKLALSKQWLGELIEQHATQDAHPFFRAYAKRLKQRSRSPHDKALNRRIKQMERLFMRAVFNKTPNDCPLQLTAYLQQHHRAKLDLLQEKSVYGQRKIRLGFAFSAITGGLFGFGTLYLLAEGFVTLGFIPLSAAALPALIVPLAILSAGAYTLLTYNTITNFIQNDTVNRWLAEIKHDFTHWRQPKSLLHAVMASILISLGLFLTVCTAGTWWTVAKHVPKCLPFLKRFPAVIAGIIVPLFTGLGALVFNIENTKDSLSLLKQQVNAKQRPLASHASPPPASNPLWRRGVNSVKTSWRKLGPWRFLNPFRFLIGAIKTPLTFIAFTGHIISIGVTTDRVPGLPVLFTALLSAISEGFEDAHYFLPHDHTDGDEHGHSHNFPARFIQWCLSPLYLLSTLWVKCQSNESFTTLWQKQWGTATDSHDHHAHETAAHSDHQGHDELPPTVTDSESQSVSRALCLMQLQEKASNYHGEKAQAYQRLVTHIDQEKTKPAADTLAKALNDKLESETIRTVLAKNRSNFFKTDKTTSTTFIEQLVDDMRFENPSV